MEYFKDDKEVCYYTYLIWSWIYENIESMDLGDEDYTQSIVHAMDTAFSEFEERVARGVKHF